MTTFCPSCGTPHECASAADAAAAGAIRVAEIEAARDIELARIAARTDRVEAEAAVTIAVAETISGEAEAEGIAEGMEAVLDAGAAPEAAPAAIVQVPEAEAEAAEETEAADVPEIEVEAPERPSSRGFFGPAYR